MKTRTLTAMIVAIACLTCSTVSIAAAASQSTSSYGTSVHSYLQQLVNAQETSGLIGNAAIIKISYAKNGQFDQASISGSGDVTLARMLHRAVDWKSFPVQGTSETTILVAVNTAGNLDVTIR